jgi:hypothetical protein
MPLERKTNDILGDFKCSISYIDKDFYDVDLSITYSLRDVLYLHDRQRQSISHVTA